MVYFTSARGPFQEMGENSFFHIWPKLCYHLTGCVFATYPSGVQSNLKLNKPWVPRPAVFLLVSSDGNTLTKLWSAHPISESSNCLTNVKKGDFYGVASEWSEEARSTYGYALLFRAFKIFINEGERQLRPLDLRCWLPLRYHLLSSLPLGANQGNLFRWHWQELLSFASDWNYLKKKFVMEKRMTSIWHANQTVR